MSRAYQIGRDEQAARMVAFMIEAGIIVKSPGSVGTYTVGPYTRAVGPAGFALFGYGARVPEPYQAREERRALDAARLFVGAVGSGRAREAALRAPGRPPFSTAGADVARQKAEHARRCRKVWCKECGEVR